MTSHVLKETLKCKFKSRIIAFSIIVQVFLTDIVHILLISEIGLECIKKDFKM